MKKTREIKPEGVRFLVYLSSGTIQKKQGQIPKLIEASRQRKVALFMLDKLFINGKKQFYPVRPCDKNQNTRSETEHEASF